MRYAFLALALAGYYPFYRAWQANRRTSLAHAVSWGIGAWSFWAVAFMFGKPSEGDFDPWCFVALCATGAAHVAVLGARRPGVAAWNFVVAGLLAVMLLPLGESLVLGADSATWPRLLFLGATLSIGVINYAPTRLALPALLLAGVYTTECLALFAPAINVDSAVLVGAHLCLLAVPWLGFVLCKRPYAQAEPSELLALNEQWLDFRDCFGLFWAQRVREQYNNAARQVGLPGFLSWRGWEPRVGQSKPTEKQWDEMQHVLTALLKRFRDDAEPIA